MSNIEIFKECLNDNHNETDTYYVHYNKIINLDLESKWKRLNNLIIEYNKKTNNKDIINEIIDILETKNIQYTEFVSFFKNIDFSYSLYKGLEIHNKRDKIKEIIQKYKKERVKEYYEKNKYSINTIQALYDSGSSRKQGNTGYKKIRDILTKNNYLEINIKDLKNTEYNKKEFIKPNREIIKIILKNNNIKYEFYEENQNKINDLIFWNKKGLFFMEQKHLKEQGGAAK